MQLEVFPKIFAIFNFIISSPLNRRRKLGAFLGFVRWQIGVRVLGKPVIVPWVNNSRFIAGLSESSLTGNIYAGLMEYEDMLFMLHTLSSDMVFLDIGANVGAYTILASKVVGAKSIAFEPISTTVNRLIDQVHLNQITSLVKVVNCGVGERREILFFTNNQNTINKVVVDGSDGGVSAGGSASASTDSMISVPVTTLDAEVSCGDTYFIKIDVEGFELKVLKGAANLLASGNVLALIVEIKGNATDYGVRDQDVHQYILNFGYISVDYDPVTRTLRPIAEFNQNAGKNTIYVKDINDFQRRCRDSKKVSIHTAGGINI